MQSVSYVETIEHWQHLIDQMGEGLARELILKIREEADPQEIERESTRLREFLGIYRPPFEPVH